MAKTPIPKHSASTEPTAAGFIETPMLLPVLADTDAEVVPEADTDPRLAAVVNVEPTVLVVDDSDCSETVEFRLVVTTDTVAAVPIVAVVVGPLAVTEAVLVDLNAVLVTTDEDDAAAVAGSVS
jgi:hypothetical protein